MLPLGKLNTLPISADEWSKALASALPVIIEANSLDPGRIRVNGISEGKIESLELDLSGLDFRTDISGIKFGDSDPSLLLTIGELIVKAEPGKLAGVPANVRMEARNVVLTGSHDQQGRLWLVPSHHNAAVQGKFTVNADPDDVEKAVGAILAAQAHANGVNLQDFRMKINAVSPTSAVIAAIAKGKKFGMSATIEVAGNAEVDSDLRLVLSGLTAKGDGAFGSMAARMLEPRLLPWNDRKINLSLPGFERVKVTSVVIADKPRLSLTSEFGASDLSAG